MKVNHLNILLGVISAVPAFLGTGCAVGQESAPPEIEPAISVLEKSPTDVPSTEDTEAARRLRIMYEQVEAYQADPSYSPTKFLPTYSPPPDYATVLKQAETWSDEELERQIAALIEQFKEEYRWAEFLKWTYRAGDRSKRTEFPGLDESYSAVLIEPSGLWIEFALGSMSLRPEPSRTTIEGSRESKIDAYARTAGWLTEITNRRRRMTRHLLEKVYELNLEETLDLFWDPETEHLLVEPMPIEFPEPVVEIRTDVPQDN